MARDPIVTVPPLSPNTFSDTLAFVISIPVIGAVAGSVGAMAATEAIKQGGTRRGTGDGHDGCRGVGRRLLGQFHCEAHRSEHFSQQVELAPPLGAEGGHETGEIPVTVVAPVKLYIVADQQPMAVQQFDLVIGGEGDVP